MTEVLDRSVQTKIPEDVVAMLAAPFSPDCYYTSPHDQIFFAETLDAKARVPTLLEPAKRVYPGRWYHQGDLPTCLPWSVMNACLVSGIEPSPYLASALISTKHQIVIPKEARKKLGLKPGQRMDYEEAIEILRDYPEAGFTLEPYRGFNLESMTLTGRLWSILIEDEKSASGCLFEDLLEVYWPPNRDLVIRENAALVLDSIGRGSVLLLSVISQKYRGLPLTGNIMPRHAICLSGYQVDEQSYMNVQVVDSARGVFWVSLEHVSESSSPQSCWQLVKT